MSNRNKFIYEHSIAMDKLSFLLESAYPKFKIDAKTELYNEYVSDPELFSLTYSNDYITLESFSDFKVKIKNLCEKIKEEVLTFIRKIQFIIAKFITKMQINKYNKRQQFIDDFLIEKIGFKPESISRFVENYSIDSAMLEKKILIYNKFFTLSKSRPITSKELNLMNKALKEVEEQYRSGRGFLSRGSITKFDFTSSLTNTDFFKFMTSDVEEAYKSTNKIISDNSDASICNIIGTIFKDFCNTITRRAKLTHETYTMLHEITTKYQLPNTDTSINHKAEIIVNKTKATNFINNMIEQDLLKYSQLSSINNYNSYS